MHHALWMPVSPQVEIHHHLRAAHHPAWSLDENQRLHRVVDFSENRDILEQLFGLKTVWIFSGDRTNPKLDIYGIRENIDVVNIVRTRVEYNKRRKGIYEITNR